MNKGSRGRPWQLLQEFDVWCHAKDQPPQQSETKSLVRVQILVQARNCAHFLAGMPAMLMFLAFGVT